MTVEMSRLAVETGIFVLWEQEGSDIANRKVSCQPKEKRKPVEEYFKLQGRFRHLLKMPEIIEQIQKEVDEKCAQFEP